MAVTNSLALVGLEKKDFNENNLTCIKNFIIENLEKIFNNKENFQYLTNLTSLNNYFNYLYSNNEINNLEDKNNIKINGNLIYWAPLPSFGRIIMVFSSIKTAVILKLLLECKYLNLKSSSNLITNDLYNDLINFINIHNLNNLKISNTIVTNNEIINYIFSKTKLYYGAQFEFEFEGEDCIENENENENENNSFNSVDSDLLKKKTKSLPKIKTFNNNLKVPDRGKLLFISPPPSPPPEWIEKYGKNPEEAPNRKTHFETENLLAEALKRLQSETDNNSNKIKNNDTYGCRSTTSNVRVTLLNGYDSNLETENEEEIKHGNKNKNTNTKIPSIVLDIANDVSNTPGGSSVNDVHTPRPPI